MKIKNIIPIVIFLLGCNTPDPNKKKVIDTGKFEVEVPGDWKYVKERGVDSFVGCIKNKEIELNFDWSEMGYANNLIPSTEEYLNEYLRWKPRNTAYVKNGIIYIAGDVDTERKRVMAASGITDSTLVKVEKLQPPKTGWFFKEGKYIGVLTYRDTTLEVNIEIPDETQQHQFQVDTIDGYYRKIIWPQNGFNGLTGVYFHRLNSSFNFQISGTGLSPENQQKAIAAFKTIKMKNI